MGGHPVETHGVVAGFANTAAAVAFGQEMTVDIVVGIVTGGTLDFPPFVVRHGIGGAGMS